MNKEETPKARRVSITFKEYKAIQLGLSEIEGAIGYGDLPENEVKKYKECESALRKLLYKIINSKNK